MKGVCHLWSRGRLISHSLPVGDDWYLNLSSQKKRPTGRNLGGNLSVRRSGSTSRCTVVLVSRLRMRSFPRTEVLTIFLRKKIRLASSKYQTLLIIFSCQLTSSCAYTGSLKLGIGRNTVHCTIKRYLTEFTVIFSVTISNINALAKKEREPSYYKLMTSASW